MNPNEIQDKVLRDPDWGKRLLNYLDDIIMNVVPTDPMPNMCPLWDEKDPCTLCGVNLNLENVGEQLALRMKDVM